MNCAAVVLAAGNSSRMGQQKLLLPFNGQTVIQHIVNQLSQAQLTNVIVVVGRDVDQIRRALKSTQAVVIDNPEYEQGMLTSVRAGIAALDHSVEACLICLGDQPALKTPVVDAIIHLGSESDSKIIVPQYNTRRGHPLYIPRKYFNTIMSSYDDSGLRGLLQEFKVDVQVLPVTESWILDDMDYPKDYQRELRRLSLGE